MVTRDEVLAALGQVMDPEIHRPITDLDMVRDFTIGDSGLVTVEVLLTVAGCPLKDRITRDVTAAVSPLPGVTGVKVDLGVMTEDQRQAMVTRLRGPGAAQEQKKITFWGDESTTRVLAAPPRSSLASSRHTDQPASARRMAAASPLVPPPHTIAS